MRYKIVLIFFSIVWLVLLGRVFQIAIGHGEHYEFLAKENVVKKEWVLPIRAEIVDRNQRPLAINKIGFSINIAPHLSSVQLDTVLEKIVSSFDLDKTKLQNRYNSKNSFYNQDDITVRDFVQYDTMLPHLAVLERSRFIRIKPATLRHYPFANATAHVIGYVGKALKEDSEVARKVGVIGKNGLEGAYNSYLQGALGYNLIQVNARNEQLRVLERKQPLENDKLPISIDSRLQQMVHSMFKDQAGAAVVMRPNGEILASVSYPAYDPNMFVTGISQKKWDEIRLDFDSPFTNKFINGMYPPGSIIKMGVGLAMFDAGDISTRTTTYCNGSYEVGGHRFRCWKNDGHGRVNFNKAIRESCDDYFYKNSIKTGINKIAAVLRNTGLGEKTGVDLPNESYGTVPDIPWKHRRHNQRWYRGETIISSIGQGYMLATPMQMARHTALLATDKLPTPHYVSSAENNQSAYTPEVVKQNPEAMRAIRKGMQEVANHPKGTARWYLRNSNVKLAAKTGTAQVVSIPQDQKERMKESELEYYHRSHAWLSTYGPYKDPQYIVTVMVEHGGHGGSTAGPIVTKIYNWLEKNGYIKE